MDETQVDLVVKYSVFQSSPPKAMFVVAASPHAGDRRLSETPGV